ncbi:ribonuclease H-like domain-containing protein, partial [Tanacetum coccineum]
TANLSDATVYAFLANQPNRSQLVHEDLKQIHEDDLEEMDLKSPRNQESRPGNHDNGNRNQDSSRRTVNVEETSPKVMVAINGAGFDWSFMAEEEVTTNIALMAFSDSEVYNDKTCFNTCLKSFETLKTQLDNLRVEFNKTEFNLATYKRWLASVEEQLVFYKKNEVMFSDQIAVLKRDTSFKDSEIIALKSEIEKLKKEKECNQIKIGKFENASKCLDKLIGSQISDNNRKGPEFKGYRPKASKSVCVDTSNEVKKTPDTPLVKEPKAVNTARPHSAVVNAVRANQANAVKALACWVWRPTKLDSASITLKKHNYIDARGRSKSVMAWDMLSLVEESKDERSLVQNHDEPEPPSDAEKKDDEGSLHINTVSPTVITTRSNLSQTVSNIFSLRDNVTSEVTHTDLFGDETEMDMSNLNTSYQVPTTPNIRIHKDHSLDHEEPKRVTKALSDLAWVEAMQEELLQFKLQKVWVLVDLPKGKRAIGTKWIFKNKKDERGIVIMNKARLIKEEVYVCQPPGFEDPDYPNKVYKVVKALYGLHQAPRAWYETLAKYLLDNGFHRGKIDETLFIKKQKGDILLVQMSSMGELTFFLDVRTASTPMDTEKPLLMDSDGDDVDVHLYRSKIRSLMYLTSSKPNITFVVGDEAVHKELGDRMERAATTASSLEAEQDSDAQTRFEAASKQSNDPPLSRVNILGSGEDSIKLIELMAHCTTLSKLYAITESPTIYASLIEQFWQTAALSTLEDGVMEIIATIDGRVKTITEASIRRHLKLEDSDGISTPPTAEIFKQLALMGYVTTFDSLTFQKGDFSPQWKFLIHTILHCLSPKKTAWEQFSSNIATAIICLATNITFNFSNLIFEAMVKNLDKEATPMPYESPLPRVYSLRSDEGSLSLNELTVLCTSLSKKVESLESELKQTKQTYSIALTKLIQRVKKLEQTIKTSQARRRAKVVISDAEQDKEDSSKQERSLIEELDIDAGISLVPQHVADQGRFDDTQVSDQPEEQLAIFSVAKVLADAAEQRRDFEKVQTYPGRRRAVSTSSGGVNTATELVSTASIKAKDKGKAIIRESEPPKKIKKRVQVQMSIDEELAQKVHEEEQARFNVEHEAKFKAEQEQERLDHETAIKIQEELDAAERQRMAQVHQVAQGFTDDEWDDILARVVVDKDFVQQLQAGEKVSDEDLPRKLVELVNQ